MIGKQLTSPLWRIIEDEEIDQADFGGIVKGVVNSIDQLARTGEGIESFLNGEVVLSETNKWFIKKDNVYNELKKPNVDIDDEAAALLRVLLPSLSQLFREHFQMQIEFYDNDEAERASAKERTQSCIKHNILLVKEYLLC